MNKNNNLAKQIFLKYEGIIFFMAREGNGDYEQYKSLCVSKSLEEEWLHEIQQDLFNELNLEHKEKMISEIFEKYAQTSRELNDKEALQFMIIYIQKNLSKWDSNTLLRCINAVINARLIGGQNAKAQKSVIDMVLKILKSVEGKKITVAESYKENGKLPYYLEISKLEQRFRDVVQYCEHYTA